MTTQNLIDAIKTRFNYENPDAHAFAVGYLWAGLTDEQKKQIIEKLTSDKDKE